MFEPGNETFVRAVRSDKSPRRSFARGFVIALPAAVLLWTAIFWLAS